MNDFFTAEEIEKLKHTTVQELAMHLEDGLIHACILNEETNVYDYIKNILIRDYIDKR